MRPDGNVFTAGGLALRTTDIICIKSLKYLFDRDSDILFHNQVLLIIIACLRYFSRTEDSYQFGLVNSFVLSCFHFHFYLVKRKALTRRSAFHYAHMMDQIISGLHN